MRHEVGAEKAPCARNASMLASYRRGMFGTGSILDQFAALFAFLATAMALGGFLGHARPALRGESENELRRATARGGLFALGGGFGVAVLSAGWTILIA